MQKDNRSVSDWQQETAPDIGGDRMLQVMIKVSEEARGFVYSLEVYQESRFVRCQRRSPQRSW